MPPAAPSLRLQSRVFSTSAGRAKAARPNFTSIKTLTKKATREHGGVPAYPYPARTTYKQSNYGLYGSTHIQSGNKVSEKGGNKSRRYWRPNIQIKQLWSEALGRMVRLRVQARVLRTIDKVGGLDEYLLGNKEQRIKDLGVAGWALRWSLINTDKIQSRFRGQRKKLGVPKMDIKARLRLREKVAML